MKQSSKLLQVGVKVILLDKNGKILLLKRNADVYKKTAGSWDIPGGRINPSSPLEANLEREVREETTLKLDKDDLRLLAAQDIILEDKHVVRLTYIGRATGEIELRDGENTEFQWVGPSEALDIVELDKYLRGVLQGNNVSCEN